MANNGDILVVDDTPASLQLVSGLLASEGYSVRPADGGELALASAEASQPELILLDIRMPGLGGFEVFERLKAKVATAAIPVIFLTAATEPEERIAGLKLGAVDYIIKPFNREELLAKVKTHVELFRLTKTLAIQTRKLSEERDRLATLLADLQVAQKEIERQSGVMKSLVDNIPVGVFMVEAPSGKPVFANAAALKMLGRGILPDANKQNLSEVYASYKMPGRIPYPVEEMPIVRGMKGETTHVSDMLVVRPEGGESFLEIFGSAVRNEKGEVFASLVSFLDITSRLATEDALRTEKDNLNAIFESSPVAMFILDEKVNVVKLNNAALRMTEGGAPEPSLRQPGNALGCVHSSADPRGCGYSKDCKVCPVRNAIENLLAKGGAVHGAEVALNLVRAGKPQEVWIRIGAEPLQMDGRRHLCVSMDDITERKRSEEELSQSEERFRVAQEVSPDGFTVLHPLRNEKNEIVDFSWVYENKAIARINGTDPNEIIGKRLLDLFPTHAGTPLFEMYVSVANTRIPQIIEEIYVGEILSKPTWLRIVVLSIGGDIAIHAHDISGSKLAEEEKLRIHAQLQQSQKIESVGRLAGGVAHDFNNLLTAIGGYAGFLARRLSKDDPKQEDVKEIIAATERAAGLTRQLLAFSRKQILNPQVLDLNASVMGVAKMLKRLIGEHIRLQTKFAAQACHAKLDPGQIDQVLMNLAVNSRDAMPQGGVLTLETGIMTPDEGFCRRHPGLAQGPLVCLTIRDTGCGMTDEAKAHLFEPFFTTKDQGKGTGLGLSTVFGIIKQSGGEIEVDSEPNSGTTFRLYFPHIEVSVLDKDKDKDKDTLLLGSETILLVEDEDMLRRLAERLLKTNGYTVIAAADGKSALEAAERYGKPFDLLVTDVVMPGMTGRELAKEMAARKWAGRTLYMSGYTDDAISEHGVLEPGIAFIYKPFSVEALSAKLREVLDGPADKAKP